MYISSRRFAAASLGNYRGHACWTFKSGERDLISASSTLLRNVKERRPEWRIDHCSRSSPASLCFEMKCWKTWEVEQDTCMTPVIAWRSSCETSWTNTQLGRWNFFFLYKWTTDRWPAPTPSSWVWWICYLFALASKIIFELQNLFRPLTFNSE